MRGRRFSVITACLIMQAACPVIRDGNLEKGRCRNVGSRIILLLSPATAATSGPPRAPGALPAGRRNKGQCPLHMRRRARATIDDKLRGAARAIGSGKVYALFHLDRALVG